MSGNLTDLAQIQKPLAFILLSLSEDLIADYLSEVSYCYNQIND